MLCQRSPHLIRYDPHGLSMYRAKNGELRKRDFFFPQKNATHDFLNLLKPVTSIPMAL